MTEQPSQPAHQNHTRTRSREDVEAAIKAYDIRGRLGIDLDEDVAWRVGRAFAARPFVGPVPRVVVGRDGRESSPALAAALIRGLTEGGADVLDLGLAGTEEMYFATAHHGADGGIEVTASHNPIDYNGMKLVGRDFMLRRN